MRKILLTESQGKMLFEEIDRNDTAQKLALCKPEDITFKETDESYGKGEIFRVVPVIDGKEIDDAYVSLLVENINISDRKYYQLHIKVNESLRNLGIAYKIYVAFIKQGHQVCSFFKNRERSFYSDKTTNDSIPALWKKISDTEGIKIRKINDKKGNNIGIIAHI